MSDGRRAAGLVPAGQVRHRGLHLVGGDKPRRALEYREIRLRVDGNDRSTPVPPAAGSGRGRSPRRRRHRAPSRRPRRERDRRSSNGRRPDASDRRRCGWRRPVSSRRSAAGSAGLAWHVRRERCNPDRRDAHIAASNPVALVAALRVAGRRMDAELWPDHQTGSFRGLGRGPGVVGARRDSAVRHRHADRGQHPRTSARGRGQCRRRPRASWRSVLAFERTRRLFRASAQLQQAALVDDRGPAHGALLQRVARMASPCDRRPAIVRADDGGPTRRSMPSDVERR